MGLKAQFEAAKDEAAALVIAARSEDRGLTDEETLKFQSLMKTAQDVKAAMEKAVHDQELLKEVNALGDPSSPSDEDGPATYGIGGTPGDRFVNAPAFKQWMRQYPNGRIPESAKNITSPPVTFKGLKDLQFQQKTLVTSSNHATSAGPLVPYDYRGLLDTGTFQRPLTIRDIITVGATASDAVEYAIVSSFTNNAAAVAEATASTGTSGTKPESALATTRATASVKTIAHWIPATKRALADAAQIRTLIDNFLRYGLEEQLENQIVAGDGVGENFTGLMNVSGVQTQAFTTDLLTTYRNARTKVRTIGRTNPQAYIINPVDWQNVSLMTNNMGGFYFGGPGEIAQPRMWGLPVIESEAVPAGTALVGDFSYAVLWDREQLTVQASDSHSDYFVRNMVAILAELRAAFGVLRPASIVKVALA